MKLIDEIDQLIMEWIQLNLQSELLSIIMKIITRIGDLLFVWVILILIYLLIKKDYKHSKLIALSLITTIILNQLLLKNIVKRPRPFVAHENLKSLIHNPSSYSFPSSHSATSFSFATSVTWINSWITIGGYLLACLIAFSRVYLNVHYPSDVLIGALLGVVTTKVIQQIGIKKPLI